MNLSGRSNFGALILVLIGLILLLNNLSILPWEVWNSIWRLWPILLICWGLQLMFGHSRFASLIINLLCLIVVVLIVAYFISLTNPSFYQWLQNQFPQLHLKPYNPSFNMG